VRIQNFQLCLIAAAPIAFAQDGSTYQVEAGTSNSSPAQRVEILQRLGAAELRRAASVAKQVYGRDELDRFGDTHVLDVLRRMPGLNVGAEGVRMRSLGSGYTQILVNGSPAPAGFALDQLGPEQVERIEVLRAPTADQSAQGIAGTVNIILKEAPRSTERQLRASLTRGLTRPMVHGSLTFGERQGMTAFTLPLSIFERARETQVTLERRSSGEDGQTALSLQTGDQRTMAHGLNLGPRLHRKFSDDHELSLQGFVQTSWWKNSTEYQNKALVGSPLFEDDTWQRGMSRILRTAAVWSYRFAPDQRIELRAGVEQARWTFDRRTGHEWAGTQAAGGGTERRVTQAGKYSRLVGSDHSLTIGWDADMRIRHEQRVLRRNGVLYLPQFEGRPVDVRIRRQAFYIQDEWQLSEATELNLGLRQEAIQTVSWGTEPGAKNASSVMSPLLHMTWKLDPKGQHKVRASVSRSYKAPDPGALLARPSVNIGYLDTERENTRLAPDRIGNPSLTPELATGVDIAIERHFSDGGLWSVGLFYRRMTDLVRAVTTLQTVPWASVPRWIEQPVNVSSAVSRGIEFEARGKASQLLPALTPEATALNVRASVSFYDSAVNALPGPDNRVDGQQPWAATLGFDWRVAALPLTVGAGVTLNPSYKTQFSLDEVRERSRTRTADIFARWTVRGGLSARLAASAGVQASGASNGTTRIADEMGNYVQTRRSSGPQFSLSIDAAL
jgi:outer membrane receptor for ferrienterochelin and colicins